MISRVGFAISRIFERTAPDPLVIAIGLTLFTGVLALTLGTFPAEVESIAARAAWLLDRWRDNDAGIWKLLAFGMQMCLILVTGHALATTRPVRKMIASVARLPQSTASAAMIVSLIACVAGLVNWGLGLIVGALLAREVGHSMQARGIRCHYPLVAAAGYSAMLIWHGGLSGSAPLSMSTVAGARKVIPEQFLSEFPQGVPLTHTLLSPLNLFVSGGLLILVPLVFMLLAPRGTHVTREVGSFPPDHAARLADDDLRSNAKRRTISQWLEESPMAAWVLAAILLAAMLRFASSASFATLGLNEINAIMLALGLALHASPRAYMAAAEEGARGCAGIIVQFPLYAGIMALMESSGLVASTAEMFTRFGTDTTIPVMSFLSACIVNLFIPSGGGQWAIQGPVALSAGAEAGIAPGRMIMAVAYGDQLTNMLQPFWALPLLAITGVKAGEIVGYTALVMLVAGAWMALGLLLF